MTKEEFIDELSKINIILNDKQLEQLDKYYQLLVEWNKKINLTRIIDEKEVYLKHFYDSLTLNRVIDLNNHLSVCDIGTGAGFPGVVLKIVFPTLSLTLVDSLLKRINFLNCVIHELNLKDIEAIHARAEDFAKYNKNKYDIVTCRAVSKLSNLINYCIPIVKKNGFFIPMKANCDEELLEVHNVLKKQRLNIEKKEEFYLPFENSHRTIIKIQKK